LVTELCDFVVVAIPEFCRCQFRRVALMKFLGWLDVWSHMTMSKTIMKELS